ncbi:MAG: hypothetical protein KDA87_26235, partial [Planctomycetales bacterium]|nr:hypothetical protein [Planctomycetales bacterium]
MVSLNSTLKSGKANEMVEETRLRVIELIEENIGEGVSFRLAAAAQAESLNSLIHEIQSNVLERLQWRDAQVVEFLVRAPGAIHVLKNADEF